MLMILFIDNYCPYTFSFYNVLWLMVNRHNNFVAILIIINNCQSGRSNKETKNRPGYIYTFSNFTIRVRTRFVINAN